MKGFLIGLATSLVVVAGTAYAGITTGGVSYEKVRVGIGPDSPCVLVVKRGPEGVAVTTIPCPMVTDRVIP